MKAQAGDSIGVSGLGPPENTMSFWKHHFRSKILHAIYQTTVQELN